MQLIRSRKKILLVIATFALFGLAIVQNSYSPRDRILSSLGNNPSYSIYREEFVFNTNTTEANIALGAGMYIYNSSVSVTNNVSAVSTSWNPVSLGFNQSNSQTATVSFLVFLWIDPTNVWSNFTLNTQSGVTNFTIYNFNGPNPVKAYSGLDTNSKNFNVDFSDIASLTNPGPYFTVQDNFRAAVDKLVFAHYYGWYNNQTWFGGRNGSQSSAVTGVPLLGYYDSHNVSIIDEQINLAKSHGVSGFIAAWGGVNASSGGTGSQNFLNESDTLLFQESAKLGSFKDAVEYQTETLVNLSLVSAQTKFVNDMEYFLPTYAQYPALFKVNGWPVVFVYLTDSFPLSFWQSAISQIKQVYPDVYFIADSYNYSQLSVFDGLSPYTVGFKALNSSSSWINGTTPKNFYAEVEANLHNKLWFACAQTGFDNINSPREVYSYWPRDNGSTYLTSWAAAIGSDPNGVIITTWNEWHEGTNIEPLNTSDPMPDYWAYPNQYLDLTANESALFIGPSNNITTSTTTTLSRSSSSHSSSSSSSFSSSSSASSESSISNSSSATTLLTTTTTITHLIYQSSSSTSNSTQSNSVLGFLSVDPKQTTALTYGSATSLVIFAIGLFWILAVVRKQGIKFNKEWRW